MRTKNMTWGGQWCKQFLILCFLLVFIVFQSKKVYAANTKYTYPWSISGSASPATFNGQPCMKYRIDGQASGTNGRQLEICVGGKKTVTYTTATGKTQTSTYYSFETTIGYIYAGYCPGSSEKASWPAFSSNSKTNTVTIKVNAKTHGTYTGSVTILGWKGYLERDTSDSNYASTAGKGYVEVYISAADIGTLDNLYLVGWASDYIPSQDCWDGIVKTSEFTVNASVVQSYIHTHNSSGTEYSSTGNNSTHTKYTYCTDHGTDHTQNRVGTSEAHTDTNNDGACDKCSQVYRTRGYLDLNGVLNGVTSGNIAGYGTANVYVAGRGTSSNVTDYYYLTAAGTSYNITPKANSGYTYLGVVSGSLSGTMPSSNYGVYLKFGSNYTITFNGNGATSGSTASESRVYSDSTKPLTANGFERTHYLFNGWNTKADGSGTGYSDKQSVNNLTSTVNGTVTLYAQWKDEPGYHDGKAIVYTITYTLYPKNGANITITDPGNPTTYTVEDEITLKNPSATNYSFEGWYGSGTSGSKGVTIVQGSMGDLHFEADWLPTKDPNKSSGKDQTVPYVKTTPIIENKVQIAA